MSVDVVRPHGHQEPSAGRDLPGHDDNGLLFTQSHHLQEQEVAGTDRPAGAVELDDDGLNGVPFTGVIEHLTDEGRGAVVNLGEGDVDDRDLGAARKEVEEYEVTHNQAHRYG